jgi:serine/threonine protein phosphatase PrpC
MGKPETNIAALTSTHLPNTHFAIVQMPSKKNEDRFVVYNKPVAGLCDAVLAVADGHNGE